MFIHHKHFITVKLVGRWGVLRCRYWWDLGPLPPYCTNAPIIFDPPRHWSAPTWARGQRCLQPNDLVRSPGVAAALVWLPSQLRVCITKRRVTSVSDAAGPGGAAYMASAARLKRPEPGSKFRHRPRICIDADFENVGMGHVLLSSLNKSQLGQFRVSSPPSEGFAFCICRPLRTVYTAKSCLSRLICRASAALK